MLVFVLFALSKTGLMRSWWFVVLCCAVLLCATSSSCGSSSCSSNEPHHEQHYRRWQGQEQAHQQLVLHELKGSAEELASKAKQLLQDFGLSDMANVLATAYMEAAVAQSPQNAQLWMQLSSLPSPTKDWSSLGTWSLIAVSSRVR